MKCAILALTAALASAHVGSSAGLVGQKFKGYYNDNIAHFSAKNYDGRSFVTGAIAKKDEGSHYSYSWKGTFTPDRDGTYCFKTMSDDASMVYIDGVAVVNNAGPHALKTATGCHTYKGHVHHGIMITFGERTGLAGMHFQWLGGSQKGYTSSLRKNIFSTKKTFPILPAGRLTAQKYNGYWNDKTSFFNSARKMGAAFDTFLIARSDEGSRYSYKWTGYFTPAKSGSYCFYTNSDDASAVFIDGTMRVNNLRLHGMVAKTGCHTFTRGKSSKIEMYFGEYGGGAAMQFKWKGPGMKNWMWSLDHQFSTKWRSCSHLTCKWKQNKFIQVTHDNAERHGYKHKCFKRSHGDGTKHPCICMCAKSMV